MKNALADAPLLQLYGIGAVTSSLAEIRPLLADENWRDVKKRTAVLPEETLRSQDRLAALAIGAIYQAWTGATLSAIPGNDIGLLVQTAWGTADATVDYLNSMLADEGRFASPRHFSRSVYSSVASAAAIHFKIHGPCETLVFGDFPLTGLMRQASRLLRRGRCSYVIACWVDQRSDIAESLVGIAVDNFPGPVRRTYERYRDLGLGEGAVAAVFSLAGGVGTIDLERLEQSERIGISASVSLPPHKPFPLDVSLRWASLLGENANAMSPLDPDYRLCLNPS